MACAASAEEPSNDIDRATDSDKNFSIGLITQMRKQNAALVIPWVPSHCHG